MNTSHVGAPVGDPLQYDLRGRRAYLRHVESDRIDRWIEDAGQLRIRSRDNRDVARNSKSTLANRAEHRSDNVEPARDDSCRTILSREHTQCFMQASLIIERARAHERHVGRHPRRLECRAIGRDAFPTGRQRVRSGHEADAAMPERQEMGDRSSRACTMRKNDGIVATRHLAIHEHDWNSEVAAERDEVIVILPHGRHDETVHLATAEHAQNLHFARLLVL